MSKGRSLASHQPAVALNLVPQHLLDPTYLLFQLSYISITFQFNLILYNPINLILFLLNYRVFSTFILLKINGFCLETITCVSYLIPSKLSSSEHAKLKTIRTYIGYWQLTGVSQFKKGLIHERPFGNHNLLEW